jgi:hypothetical protein
MDEVLKKLRLDNTLNKNHFRQKRYNKIFLEVPHFEDFNLMADLIEMPETKKTNYKYIFVIVDLYSLEFDAEPVKTKQSSEVLSAMLKIFKRGEYVKKPYASINTDGGSEFKSVFHKWIYDENIYHKMAGPYRHKQQSVVESLNRQIVKLLFLYLNQKTTENNGENYTNWEEFLPEVVKTLNEYRQEHLFKKYVKKYKDYNIINQEVPAPKFKVGQVVHFKLDYPENQNMEKQATAKFREGDRRYSGEVRKIVHIIMMNTQPYWRYLLEGKPNISYSEYELIPASVNYSTYKVKRIIDKKVQKKVVYYLVWWLHELKKDATWETEQALIEDGLSDYIEEYKQETNRKNNELRQKIKKKQLKDYEKSLGKTKKVGFVEEPEQEQQPQQQQQQPKEYEGRTTRSGKKY